MTQQLPRFLSKINVTSRGCWEWTATLSRNGYSLFSIGTKRVLGHRFIYEYYHGNLDEKFVIDHLCRNRACCNPCHLEQVTIQQNVLRGFNPCAHNARKTHCPKGHEFTADNVYRLKTGSKYCKQCVLEKGKRRKLENPEYSKNHYLKNREVYLQRSKEQRLRKKMEVIL